MVRHIYLFRLKDPDSWQEAADKLLTLKEHVPEIMELEVGRDFRGAENSYDLCEVVSFRTQADFWAFSKNEYHASIRTYMSQVQRDGVKIDYQIGEGESL